ncbi:tetraspanin-7 isoform X1 [Ovis aries]|uniref:tetraspanin-7 isoform X1 n=1 Tax=Ovis aries TaxID=9940 RepID=UPI0023FB4DCD|nr:tetraspanin-7 isoform X1 [Ovis aries]
MASRRMETKPVITCLKTLLIIYSFVFWITGVILLAVGVWGKLTLGTYISLIAENSTNAPYVLIGTGTTIVVFGLFGCFATCRGSPWMLKLYAMFLSLVFLAELVAGISGFVFRHEIKDTFLRTYTDAMQNYNGNDERSRAVDHVQRSLSCCGVQNYTNWSTSPYFLEHGVPPSCCMNDTDCNPQDLHNLTVAATKVNQKVLSPPQPQWDSVVNIYRGLFCLCEMMTDRLEMVILERVKNLPLWFFLGRERPWAPHF